jgi:hypothetical protein
MHKLPIQDFAFFADESGISNDRYTVVSGVTVHKSAIKMVYSTISAFRKRTNMNAELKWSKISDGRESEYRQLIETFFAMNNSKLLEFHAVSFDNHRWNHKKFNKDDSDIGLSKLYYQLIMQKLIDPHGDQSSLFVCLDNRHSSTDLSDFHQMLNRGAKKEFKLDYGPVTQLMFRDSKKDDMLQLNDVILGAITAMKNGRHLIAGGRASKKRLAELVFAKSGLPALEKNSPPTMTHFSFWNREPQD